MFVLCVLMGTVVTVRQYAGGKQSVCSFVCLFVYFVCLFSVRLFVFCLFLFCFLLVCLYVNFSFF